MVRNVDSALSCVSKANRIFKEIALDGMKILAPGSDISIIRLDVFKRMRYKIFKGREYFITADFGELTTLGSFDRTVKIDGFDFNIKFYVAEKFPYEAAIGNDILHQTDIILTSNGATFSKGQNFTQEEQIIDDFDAFCSAVVIENEDEYKLLYLSKATAEEIGKLIRGYNPVNCKPSPITMKIVLSDDVLIY